MTWWPPDDPLSLMMLAFVVFIVLIAHPIYRELRWRIARRRIAKLNQDWQAARDRRAGI